jgi:hypothetical protein
LNAAPFGALFVWMVMTYVLAWWFESQVNSVLATRLLGIFADEVEGDAKVVEYVPGADVGYVDDEYTAQPAVSAGASDRPVHRSWLVSRRQGKPERVFNTYGFVELLSKLVESTNPDAAHEVDRRVQLYFALVNLVLVVEAGLLWWNFGYGDRENSVTPVVVAKQGAGERNVDLMSLLRAQPGNSGPAVVVAASGGGTRAAIYTAVALRGLHDVKADENIVAVERRFGRSGGGSIFLQSSGRAGELDDTALRWRELDFR